MATKSITKAAARTSAKTLANVQVALAVKSATYDGNILTLTLIDGKTKERFVVNQKLTISQGANYTVKTK